MPKLLPSPRRLRRALSGAAASIARRVLGIQQEPVGELRRVPDDLPRDMLFEQPLVAEVRAAVDEPTDGPPRARFKVLVRDAVGKRCPDLSVELRIDGPERSATGDTTTNMMGVATFFMDGPPGSYTAEVLDVAAHALAWDHDASTTTGTVTLA